MEFAVAGVSAVQPNTSIQRPGVPLALTRSIRYLAVVGADAAHASDASSKKLAASVKAEPSFTRELTNFDVRVMRMRALRSRNPLTAE